MSGEEGSARSVTGARRRRLGLGALVGLLPAAAAVGVSELVAAWVRPESAPVTAVGAGAIRLTPEWLKEFAVRSFGSQDKTVLLAGIYLVLAAVAVALGRLALVRPAVAAAGIGAFGVLGVVAALAQHGAGSLDLFPSVVGAVVGVVALLLLLRSLGVALEKAPEKTGPEEAAPAGPARPDRRRFLALSLGTAVVAAAAGFGGRAWQRARSAAVRSRAAVRVPVPDSPAAPAAGSDLAVPGLGPWRTPNADFYRVDTALTVPQVPADGWRLRIHGMVDRPRTINYQELLARPMIERDITLTCVSNGVGGPYAGNARWIGPRLKDLLAECGVHPGADQLVSRSADGMTIGTPTAVATDGRDAMLAVAMNGQPLPIEHGFPVRMVVPGLYGYVSACKWIVDIELTTFAAFDPYWVQRGWAQRAPIKTESRIDTPRDSAKLSAGTVQIAGVAWAQHRGVRKVEVQVDDGDWRPARLAAVPSVDTWRQWVYRWPARPGRHTLRVRATDGAGQTQTADRSGLLPDGATGYHTISVTVG